MTGITIYDDDDMMIDRERGIECFFSDTAGLKVKLTSKPMVLMVYGNTLNGYHQVVTAPCVMYTDEAQE